MSFALQSPDNRHTDALSRLWHAAQALPGETAAASCRVFLSALLPADTAGAAEGDTEEQIDKKTAASLDALRRETGQWLADLAARLEPALDAALRRAEGQWDQVDAMNVVDRRATERLARLTAAWRKFGQRGEAEHACALEAALTLEAALKIVRLLEQRLATFVRLQLTHGEPVLGADGRPFLDVAAALTAAARAWA